MAVRTNKDDKQGTGALVDYDQSYGTSTRKPGQRGRVPGRQNAPQNFNNRDRAGGGTFGAPGKKNDLKGVLDSLSRSFQGARDQLRPQEQPQEQPAETGLSLLDFLKQAQGMVGDGAGGGTNYGALKDAARQRGNEGDARLEAMYRQLGDSIRGDAGTIGGAYDQAGQEIAQTNQQAQGTVNAGYDAARAAQTDQLSKLGIGDAAAVLAVQGGNAANDQAAAQANLAQNAQAVTNQNTTGKASSLAYNTGAAGAAGLEGNMQRARVQAELTQALAELDAGEQQQNAQRSQNNISQSLSLAQALKQEQDDRLGGRAAGQQQEFENQLEADKQAYAWAKLQSAAGNNDPNSFLQALQSFGKGAQGAGIPEENVQDLFSLWYKNSR